MASEEQGESAPRPDPPYSNLQAVLDSGHFAVTCELGPPREPEAADVLEKAALLRGQVNAASCTDNQGAGLRMCALGAAILAKRGGVEPIMQIAGRDRNRLGIQSDVIAAQAFGIPNLMSISGDSLILGDHPMAKPVFDMRGAGKGRKARQKGIKICCEIIQQVRETEGVHGVHIMAIDWERAVPNIVEESGLELPRPIPVPELAPQPETPEVTA